MASRIRSLFHIKNSFCNLNNAFKLVSISRSCSNTSLQNSDPDHRNQLFSNEQKRQIESVGRIEKITVRVSGPPEDITLYMNKDLSTPYDCARHVSDAVVHRAALALIDSNTIWDMHQPLTSNCTLKFLYFDDEDPSVVNKAFWESCSIILGKVISNAFKDNVSVMLYQYPVPSIRSGSFVYDAKLSLQDWKPNYDELRILTAEMLKTIHEDHKFEKLIVSKDLALEIMKGNKFKEDQIHKITPKDDDAKVVLYRIGTHIDVCKGPLISTTSLINKCSITAVHIIKSSVGPLHRFQGVALPKPLLLNHFAYGVLENRAKNLNPGHYRDIHSAHLNSG